MEFRRIRNRIERFFAHIDHHKILHYNQHRIDFVKSGFGLLWNAECFRWKFCKRELYRDTVVMLDAESKFVNEWKSRPDCCTFFKDDARDKEVIKDYRDSIKRELYISGISNVGKCPAHAKKSVVAYTKLTKSEIQRKNEKLKLIHDEEQTSKRKFRKYSNRLDKKMFNQNE